MRHICISQWICAVHAKIKTSFQSEIEYEKDYLDISTKYTPLEIIKITHVIVYIAWVIFI